MKQCSEVFIGIDTAKARNAVAVAEAGRDGEIRYLREFDNTPDATAKLIRKLAGRDGTLHFCYEAGPTGYGLYRQILALGHECIVVAPSLISRRSGDRVKTNRRDAQSLARLLRAGELTAVWVPDETHEAIGDLVRTRAMAVEDYRPKRQHVTAFLLRHGRSYDSKTSWRGRHKGSVANLADRSAWCMFAGDGFGGEHVMIEFKGSHFERDVILWAVRWYVAYPISYRQLEEMMAEHGVEVDHATLNRWVVKYVPLLDQAFRLRKRRVGPSWRMDETYVRVKGAWKYLYRAVDKAGATVDFLLTAKRDRKAALRFLHKAIKGNGTPEKVTIDKSGANTAAIASHNAELEAAIEIRQIKYLNNIIEQDHRAIKRLVRPMLGFKSFRSAAVTLAGIELMHMIRKGQLRTTGDLCPAQQFNSLAG